MKKILAFALALAMILTCSLALADRLDDIKAAGKLTVATSPDWPPYEYIDDDGNIKLEYLNAKGETVSGQVYIAKSATGIVPDYKNGDTYSNNYLQVTLDAAAALRRGDIDYANACIDRIVSSSENLLVEIADLGNSEEYIEFNQTRFDTRTLNLKERQKDLEATNLESEITLMKTYEAIYNACLQMSSSIVPNSIFNYIR